MNINLILGLIWLVWFFVLYFTTEEMHILEYWWLLFSFTYLGLYVYQRKHQYVVITKDRIKINGPFGKEFLIKDILVKKKFAGDYILKTDTKEMGISTQMVHKDSLEQLEQALDQIPIAWS